MAVIQYFAYGSNMLSERLHARCPSARVRGVAFVDNYSIAFWKRSQDGSGKATLSPSIGGRAAGVVFDLDVTDLVSLDTAEGAGTGYDRVSKFLVRMESSGEQLATITYLASPSSIDQELKPYDWYWKLVLAGARQHDLPLGCVRKIEAMPWVEDPEPKRPSRIDALKLLGEA